MSRLVAALGRWETLLVLLLAGTVALGAALTPTFVSATNLSLVTADLMEKAVMAIPLTMIIIAGQIDLSVASVLGLASAVLGRWSRRGSRSGSRSRSRCWWAPPVARSTACW